MKAIWILFLIGIRIFNFDVSQVQIPGSFWLFSLSDFIIFFRIRRFQNQKILEHRAAMVERTMV
jgi:hypothetical protein